MSNRRIFRAEAREHHRQNRDQIVLPRLATPRAFHDLWILVLLLVAVGILIAFWPITELLP